VKNLLNKEDVKCLKANPWCRRWPNTQTNLGQGEKFQAGRTWGTNDKIIAVVQVKTE